MPLIQIKLINGEPMGRPVNPYCITTEEDLYLAFERTVTYHPAPGCSESDGVEANLVDAVEKDNGKIEIYDVKPLYGIRELGWKEIKVWRLSPSQKVEVKEVLTPYDLIIAERKRKSEKYGYNDKSIIERVEDYGSGELALAAACFCEPFFANEYFPWDLGYFKPTPNDRIKELVKAGAFIIDEITRLQAMDNTH